MRSPKGSDKKDSFEPLGLDKLPKADRQFADSGFKGGKRPAKGDRK
jgi:hypothetical protein